MFIKGNVTVTASYINIRLGSKVARTIDLGTGILVDVDAENQIIGIEILGSTPLESALMLVAKSAYMSPR